VLENGEKHGSVPNLHTCSGLDSHNEQKHWHSKCHYKRSSGSTSAGMSDPTRLRGLRSNRRPTGGSPLPVPAAATTTPAPGGRTAAARASGQMLLQSCPHPRRRSRGEDKYKEPEARSTDGGGDPCKENGPRAFWLIEFWCLMINTTCGLICLLVFIIIVHRMRRELD
jgi:hypothetical protein